MTKLYCNLKSWWDSLPNKQRNWIIWSTLVIFGLGIIAGDSWINILIGTIGILYVSIYGAGTTRYAFLLGIVYVSIYTIICLQNRIMLDALQNIILIPIYIASFIHWGKASVKPRNMNYNQRVYSLLALAASIAILFFISVALNGNYSMLDAINTTCTIGAMIMGYYGFTENWALWTINNAVSAFTFLLVLFTPTGSITVLLMKLIFFANGIIGWRNFYKIGKNQSID